MFGPSVVLSLYSRGMKCPGTARSAASAGRSLIVTSGVGKRFPRPRVRSRGTCSLSMPAGVPAQRAPALDVRRWVDRLM